MGHATAGAEEDAPRRLFHYTDAAGYKAISAQPVWVFKARQPPADPATHPPAAYFTDLVPGTPNLAKRLRIPKRKTEFCFALEGDEGLERLRGGRGAYVFFSRCDYHVDRSRQMWCGPTEEWSE